ncbi:MAG: M15 family metallopeptidase [Bacteroidales bacterium]|jgi:D-alanyl-D-alanine dipeptidase|nr:M15 family metallopeptidase [Bacteroidales bacterium]
MKKLCGILRKIFSNCKRLFVLAGMLLPFLSNAGSGQPPKSALERRIEKAGLVDVQTIDPTVAVRLVYATADNFTGKILYDSLHRAYLLPHVARMVANAQKTLRSTNPDLRLIILDAVRPRNIQRKMWDKVKGTPLNIYVSNPVNTSLHNFGAAVDITIVDAKGRELDMGTPFDYFGEKAHINKEMLLLQQGKLTEQQLQNRLLLRNAMKQAGFRALPTEWWHFNACSREEAKAKYKVIE